MSNLFKSKFLLGAVMLLAFVVTTSSANAAITSTLKKGSKGAQVVELQTALNITPADGSFGNKTKTAVIAWQTAHNLTADGVFGAKSRAALVNNGGTPDTGGLCPDGVHTIASNCTAVPGGTPQTGPITVSLATNNPASSTLVAGQATADLAHFAFAGTGTVTNVTLQRIGVSADATASNVYLFNGATRLTDAASVSNNGTVTFNVPAGLFTVSGSTVVSVKSDIASSTSGQTIGFKLVSFATASGTQTVNILGNIHSIASATLASISEGTVSPSGVTINPAPNVTVWQSTLNIQTRDVLMKRLALRNVGSAPASSFQNFKLYVNGVQVSTAAGLDINGYVTFDMTSAPVTLVSGSRVIRIDADIVSGSSRTVQFSLRQASDVDFVDSSFGVNIQPGTFTNGVCTSNCMPWVSTSVNTISGVNGGSLTIEKDTTSPSTNLTLGGNAVKLGTFKLTAYGEPIKIETLKVGGTFTGGNGSTNDAAVTLRNGYLLINGSSYGSTATLIPAGTSFTTNYTVYPGTPALVDVYADVYDNDGTGALDASDTILVKIITGVSNASRVDSLGSFAAPSSDVSANTLTIATTSITLSKNGNYANQTTSLPANNFKIGSFNLAGSSVEDVLLDTFEVDIAATVGAGFDVGDVRNLYGVIKNNGVVVKQSDVVGTPVAANNSLPFGSILLSKGANLTVDLFANLANDATGTIDATDAIGTVFKISGTSQVSSQTVSSGDGTTTIAGQNVAYAAASLTVSKDASSPVTAIVYDGQTVTTLAAKFTAVTSAYSVTDLTLTMGANSGTVISDVQLWDGSTMIANHAMTTATTAVFTNLNWAIPANNSSNPKILTVKLVVGNIGVGAGTSGAVITTSIAANTDFMATPEGGANAVGAGTASGSAIYAYAATPTITLVALPSTVLGTGTQTIAKFTVASNGGTIGWKKMIFAVDRVIGGTDTLSGTKLYDVTDGNTIEVPGAVTYSGSIEADGGTTGTIIFIATDETQVSTSKTYVLKTTVAGTLAAADHINVSITSPNAYVAPAAYATVAAASGATDTFVWTDGSAQSHDATTLDWNNNFLIKNLPTDTQTLTSPL